MENRSKYPERYEQVTKGRRAKILEVTKTLSHINNEPSQAAEAFLAQPLDKLIDTFFAIYGGSHFDVELWKIAAHLMEEIGEVSNEILYLSDLLQAASDQVDFGAGMKEAYERALRSEGGLDESIQQKLTSIREKNPEEALEYFEMFVVQTMRGELADVISWLSALLWKIGESWRASHVLGPGEQPPYYKFWGYIDAGYTGVQHNLACKFCGEVECQPSCRSVRMFKNVAEKMSKSYRAGDPAVKAMLGV
jgi:NTP pyrophosphatase (non-canonical NTP hydrolase)